MTAAPPPSAAARLCAACGMCCNGVLFYSMRLQPSDSARSLAALGLKLKRKDGGQHFLQPCPAHRDSRCTIYPHRPERCRIFECRQLRAVTAGKTTESAALEKIHEARDLVARMRELFHQAGETRANKAFSTRCAAVFTPPLDPSPEAGELRRRFRSAMRELENLLAREFRVEPTGHAGH